MRMASGTHLLDSDGVLSCKHLHLRYRRRGRLHVSMIYPGLHPSINLYVLAAIFSSAWVECATLQPVVDDADANEQNNQQSDCPYQCQAVHALHHSLLQGRVQLHVSWKAA